MPTKDLVADFGGVGDAQRANPITARITSGTGELIVGTGVFASGDVGKAITIWHSNFSNGALISTITGFTSAGQIALAATSILLPSDVSVDILWGTDNTNAFITGWRAYAQTQTNLSDPPILELDDGNYYWRGQQTDTGTVHYNVQNNPKIRGKSGVAANCKIMQGNTGELRFGTRGLIKGNAGLSDAGGNSVRLQTASRGAGSVFLADPSGLDGGGATYGSRIVIGRSVLIAAFDLQGFNNSFFGEPPNNYFYEHNRIIGYNSGTGEVTLETPLTQGYKSTYPEWGLRSTAFGSDKGGPATMWIAPVDGYHFTVTLENLTIDSPHNQSSAAMRHVVLNNVISSGAGFYPSCNDTFTANDGTWTQQLEVDKNVGTVTWNNCVLNRLIQQSASPNRMILNGGSIQDLGTAKYTEANNVNFTGAAKLTLGCFAYGFTSRVVLNGCTNIAEIGRSGASLSDLDGTSAAIAASSWFTWSGGLMTFPRTENNGSLGQANPLRCLVPGTWVLFDLKYMDQVVDVTEDGTTVFIQFRNTTDWPFSPVQTLSCHPCPDVTITNCTGTALELEDWASAPSRIPAYSYSKRSYTNNASGTTAKTPPFLIGRLVTAKYTVANPASVIWKPSQFDNWSTSKKSDYTSYTFAPSIACSNAGLRTVRGATTPTGSQGSDSLPDLTSIGDTWFRGASNSGPAFISTPNNGVVVTAEYQTDQGIPPPAPAAVAPLRLRLRAA